MRFCTECGLPLPADQPAEPTAPPPVGEDSVGRWVKGPVCWRCRGLGDANAVYCKFCGARYADAAIGAGGTEVPEPRATEPPPATNDSPRVQSISARLVSILRDGTDGRAFTLEQEQTDIGRTEGDVLLGDDPYLSARHARIRRRGTQYLLSDLDSVNGVFVRISSGVELRDGDTILLGQQVLRFETLGAAEGSKGPANVRGVLVFGTPEPPRMARLVQYTTEGVGRDVHYLYRDETVLGRETGDIVFTDDPFLSRRHASIRIDRSAARFTLRDLGSSNGTSLRIRGERQLAHGDQFRVGRHLFRFDVVQGAPA
ncbi:MAG: FHA domain-containing protein [Myxococcales bacterium]|nr:FHA domain-containing protein [Myxococcales bacterium]